MQRIQVFSFFCCLWRHWLNTTFQALRQGLWPPTEYKGKTWMQRWENFLECIELWLCQMLEWSSVLADTKQWLGSNQAIKTLLEYLYWVSLFLFFIQAESQLDKNVCNGAWWEEHCFAKVCYSSGNIQKQPLGGAQMVAAKAESEKGAEGLWAQQSFIDEHLYDQFCCLWILNDVHSNQIRQNTLVMEFNAYDTES